MTQAVHDSNGENNNDGLSPNNGNCNIIHFQ